jgi:hypothetical protein
MHRPPLPPQEIFVVLSSVRGWVDSKAIVRPEILCQWKNPMTPSEIEPATFWLVAHCLNQLRYRVTRVTSCRTYEIALSFCTTVSVSVMISRLPLENLVVWCWEICRDLTIFV